MISEKSAPRAEPIDERAAARVHQRVGEQKDRRQRAELRVGERNVLLDRRDGDRQRLAIEVADRNRHAHDHRDAPTRHGTEVYDMTSSMNSIAFLGVGTMGAGMAGRLLEAGFTVTVWNRHRDRTNALVARGARAADSPKAAAADADLVISMVADDAASRTVWLGPDGALAGARARHGPDRIEHALARLDRRARRSRRAGRLRAARRAGHRQPHACGLRRAAVSRRRPGRRARAGPAGARRDGQPRHRPSRPDRQRRAPEAHQQLRVRRAGGGAGRSAWRSSNASASIPRRRSLC